MSDRLYVIVAGAALLYFAMLVLAWALCVCASTADRITEQITREAVMRDNG